MEKSEGRLKMSFIDDMKKQFRRQKGGMRIGVNKMRGKMAEEVFVMQHRMAGDEVKRTGRGSDYEVRKGNLLNGKKGPRILYEVKSSSTAPLSPLQKKTQRKFGSRYKVSRPGSGFGF
jgi:hypothetical protein